MRIILERPFLSIREFPDADIPKFTLITGLNGSGKSHVLECLKAGTLTVIDDNGRQIERGEMRLETQQSLIPNAFKPSELPLRAGGITSFSQDYLEPFEDFFRRFPHVAVAVNRDLWKLVRLTDAELGNLDTIGAAPWQRARHQIVAATEEANRLRFSGIPNHERRGLERYMHASGKEPFELSDDELNTKRGPDYGRTRLFQQSFSQLFQTYHTLVMENRFRRMQVQDGETPDQPPLAEHDFIARHGQAPWVFVNECLRTAGLDFAVDEPNYALPSAAYMAQMRKVSSGHEVAFEKLSSGEKILIAFAFAAYYAGDTRQDVELPRLLLLDEIDAPLHPLMVKNLLRMIVETIVGKFGISVIMVTHSPTTIALAPQGSIYLLTDGRSGLKPMSRSTALNTLTTGVPTVAFAIDGRRKVFVEAHADVHLYDRIYSLLRSDLSPERSLEFIATGTRNEVGEEAGNGCARVKDLVTQLGSNPTVFGLLDWDGGRNKSSAKIAVLAEGKRNGLENVILDPLAVAALIVRDYPNEADKIGAGGLSWADFMTLPYQGLQPIITSAYQRILKGAESGRQVESEYFGGFSLMIDQACLLMDDHEYEQKVLAAFGPLQGIARAERGGSAGKLLLAIAERVFRDKKDFIPSALVECMRDLLERDAHYE